MSARRRRATPPHRDRLQLNLAPEVRAVLRARAQAAAPDTETAVGSRLLRVAVLGLTDDVLGHAQELARRLGQPVEAIITAALREALPIVEARLKEIR